MAGGFQLQRALLSKKRQHGEAEELERCAQSIKEASWRVNSALSMKSAHAIMQIKRNFILVPLVYCPDRRCPGKRRPNREPKFARASG
jgi:hypothetical protein